MFKQSRTGTFHGIKGYSLSWEHRPKSEEFATSTVRDFFDLGFTSLPHKVLEEEAFQHEALLLRERCGREKEIG